MTQGTWEALKERQKCICGANQGEKHLTGCPRGAWPIGYLDRAENILPEKALPPEADWSEAIAHIDTLLQKQAESRKLMRELRVRMVLRNKPSVVTPAFDEPAEESMPSPGH